MESEDSVGGRAFWLILVPTSWAFVPWIVEAATSSSGSIGTGTTVFEVCSPLMGIVSALGFWLVSRQRVRLWPYLPFATSATFVAVSLSRMVMDPSQDGAIPVVPVLLVYLQPFIALAGGVVSFVAVGTRNAGFAD